MPVQEIFFVPWLVPIQTIFSSPYTTYFRSFVPIAQQVGQAVVPGRLFFYYVSLGKSPPTIKFLRRNSQLQKTYLSPWIFKFRNDLALTSFFFTYYLTTKDVGTYSQDIPRPFLAELKLFTGENSMPYTGLYSW